MKPINKLRFEALAGYIRRPETILFSLELEWHSDDHERVLGVLVQDYSDKDYGGVILGRDALGRFRAVDMIPFSESLEHSRELLRTQVDLWSRRPDADFSQGDERGTPTNIFTPIVSPDCLNQAFVKISTSEGFSPARALIESMMPYYEDVDGNFVEQFQTTAFDARFWELYVFALLNEQGYAFDRSFKAPDFFCQRLADALFVEAVTVNPTVNKAGIVIEPPVPSEAAEFKRYYQEYMPMKWGSSLTSKLKKKYWTLPHVEGLPIAFAIQDFHVPSAMTILSHSITSYLFGISFSALYDENETLNVKASIRDKHNWGGKEIESGFFNLPESENISAVITNPTATISKFNRMAHLAGFGLPSVKMLCTGFCHDHDPNAAIPKPFTFRVDDHRYSESWIEGVNVFHNPNAKYPLDESYFWGAAHHRFLNGAVKSVIPQFHPYQSQTVILSPART